MRNFRLLLRHIFHSLRFLAFFIIALVLLQPAPVFAQETVDITFTITGDSEQSSFTVGDVILLALEIHHPSGSRAIPPALPEQWGSFEVRSQSPAQIETLPDGSHITHQQIAVTLFSPGEHTTPAFDITLRTAAGEFQELPAPSLTIYINSVLQPGDTQLRDLKPQADMDTPFPWLAAGLMTILAALVVWRLYEKRKRTAGIPAAKTPDPRPPHEIALAELARIKQMRLPEQARFQEYYTLLGDCLRCYLEAGYNLRALERTTAEISIELERAAFPPETVQGFLALLRECDLVKFARFQPSPDTANRRLQEAGELVRMLMPPTEPPSAPPEVKV